VCGITGFVLQRPRHDIAELKQCLERMVDVIRYRGPDDDGVWTDGKVGLGHARLSIIDLTSAGHQPMSDQHDQVQLIFNGEIYNFKILREELQRAGYRFKGHSDTEVIVNGYLHWGKNVIGKLLGMFAIAIWDNRDKKLILARDRVGKKPLVYGWSQGNFLFASECKSIIAFPGVERRPNLQAIHHYLTLQYIPSPMTAFENIHRLPPGHLLELRLGKKPDIRAYHALPSPMDAVEQSEEGLKKQFIEMLEEAVKIRMVADVPIGAFLSGGVDSSAVVAMMAQNSSSPIRTFSIGFDEDGYDERKYARIVAKQYHTDHRELVVKPDALDILPKLVWYYGEPYADSSAIPSYYVSAMAAKDVTVVLNGDGGDESFLGYGRYSGCRDRQWLDKLPYFVRKGASLYSDQFPKWGERFRPTRVLRRLISQAGHLDSRLYEPAICYFTDRDKTTAYGDVMRSHLEHSTLDLLEPYFAQAPSMLAGAAWADIHTYLPDDLLVKVDIASMSNSLEARSPLLDQNIMAWAAGITDTQKMKGGETKWLMKSALEPYLPHEILYRPKMGFGVPIDNWLRNELKDLCLDCVASSKARERGLFNPDYGETILQQHCNGTLLHHTRLWAMIMLEQWFRMWIDDPDPIGNHAPHLKPTPSRESVPG